MGDLVVSNEMFGGLTSVVGADSDYDKYDKGGYLARLGFASKGKQTKSGKHVPPGHWYVQDGQDVRDLGATIDVIPLAKRRKALDLTNPDKPLTSFDVNSVEYKRIQAVAEAPSDGTMKPCMEGPEFLVIERTTGKMYTLFCSTVGLQMITKLLSGFLPRTPADCRAKGLDESEAKDAESCTLGSVMKPSKYGVQNNPTINPCATPFASLPAMERIVGEMKKFVNPSETTAVNEAEAPSRAR